MRIIKAIYASKSRALSVRDAVYEGWSPPKLVSEIQQCLHAIWHYSHDIRIGLHAIRQCLHVIRIGLHAIRQCLHVIRIGIHAIRQCLHAIRHANT
jgi:hypothetical protein